jgi:rhodanese-related sulfurtransferase
LKFLLDNWYLILAALVSGGMLAWPMVSRGTGGGGVSPAEAVRLINREKAVLIDVREAEEFAAGHAVGARNLPLATLEGDKSLPKNKTLPIVLLCAKGAHAGRAAGMLRKLGHENVQPILGGLAAWREAQLPIEKS